MEGVPKFKKLIEQDWTFHFLAGLNAKEGRTWIQVYKDPILLVTRFIHGFMTRTGDLLCFKLHMQQFYPGFILPVDL